MKIPSESFLLENTVLLSIGTRRKQVNLFIIEDNTGSDYAIDMTIDPDVKELQLRKRSDLWKHE